jgi:hypothetical protein
MLPICSVPFWPFVSGWVGGRWQNTQEINWQSNKPSEVLQTSSDVSFFQIWEGRCDKTPKKSTTHSTISKILVVRHPWPTSLGIRDANALKKMLPTMLIAFFHIYYPQRCLHWTHELRFDKKSGIVLYLLEKIGWIRDYRHWSFPSNFFQFQYQSQNEYW